MNLFGATWLMMFMLMSYLLHDKLIIHVQSVAVCGDTNEIVQTAPLGIRFKSKVGESDSDSLGACLKRLSISSSSFARLILLNPQSLVVYNRQDSYP